MFLLALLLLLVFVYHDLLPIPAASTLFPIVNWCLLDLHLLVALFQALLAALRLDGPAPVHLRLLKAPLFELVRDLLFILHPDAHRWDYLFLQVKMLFSSHGVLAMPPLCSDATRAPVQEHGCVNLSCVEEAKFRGTNNFQFLILFIIFLSSLGLVTCFTCHHPVALGKLWLWAFRGLYLSIPTKPFHHISIAFRLLGDLSLLIQRHS